MSYEHPMERERLTSIILSAPVWARQALAAPDPSIRERAAETLAAILMSKTSEPEMVLDERQLTLPIA